MVRNILGLMNMNNKIKNGFSLFEAFVVMLIVSIFVVLMANTVAHRPKAKVASEAHGRFECYYDKDNGKYYDGFSERRSSLEQLSFPDYFFFGDEVGSDVESIKKNIKRLVDGVSIEEYSIEDLNSDMYNMLEL